MPAKATSQQVRYLIAVGQFNDENITKAEATKLINQLEEQGAKPDWSLADEYDQKLRLKWKGQISREIKALKQKATTQGALTPEQQAELNKKQQELDEILAEIEVEKGDKIVAKENERERVVEIKEAFQESKHFKGFTKKPSVDEMKAAIDSLDAWNREWQDDKKAGIYIAGTLSANFPHLTSNEARPSSGKSKKRKSPSYTLLALLLIIAFAIFYWVAYANQ